jgi:negative regulator of sigma E activity
MKDVPNQELLSAYVDGELTSAEEAQVEKLLAADPAVRQLVDDFRALSATLQAMPEQKLDEDLSQRVLRAAERRVLTGSDERPTPVTAVRPWWKEISWRGMISRRSIVWTSLILVIAALLSWNEREKNRPDRPVAVAAHREDEKNEPDLAAAKPRPALEMSAVPSAKGEESPEPSSSATGLADAKSSVPPQGPGAADRHADPAASVVREELKQQLDALKGAALAKSGPAAVSANRTAHPQHDAPKGAASDGPAAPAPAMGKALPELAERKRAEMTADEAPASRSMKEAGTAAEYKRRSEERAVGGRLSADKEGAEKTLADNAYRFGGKAPGAPSPEPLAAEMKPAEQAKGERSFGRAMAGGAPSEPSFASAEKRSHKALQSIGGDGHAADGAREGKKSGPGQEAEQASDLTVMYFDISAETARQQAFDRLLADNGFVSVDHETKEDLAAGKSLNKPRGKGVREGSVQRKSKSPRGGKGQTGEGETVPVLVDASREHMDKLLGELRRRPDEFTVAVLDSASLEAVRRELADLQSKAGAKADFSAARSDALRKNQTGGPQGARLNGLERAKEGAAPQADEFLARARYFRERNAGAEQLGRSMALQAEVAGTAGGGQGGIGKPAASGPAASTLAQSQAATELSGTAPPFPAKPTAPRAKPRPAAEKQTAQAKKEEAAQPATAAAQGGKVEAEREKDKQRADLVDRPADDSSGPSRRQVLFVFRVKEPAPPVAASRALAAPAEPAAPAAPAKK